MDSLFSKQATCLTYFRLVKKFYLEDLMQAMFMTLASFNRWPLPWDLTVLIRLGVFMCILLGSIMV